MGVPLPGTLLLMGTGALAQGEALDLPAVAILALGGVVIGDSGSYFMGRYGGPPVLERLFHVRKSKSATQKTRDAFERYGGWTVFVTRFLLTPLALPTNLIAGFSGYPFRRFLAFDLAGESLWVCLCLGLGYLFADNWETLAEASNTFVWTLLIAATVALSIYQIHRLISRSRSF